MGSPRESFGVAPISNLLLTFIYRLSPLLSSPRGTELVHETWDEIMSILRKYVQDI